MELRINSLANTRRTRWFKLLETALGTYRDLSDNERDFLRQWFHQQIDTIAIVVSRIMQPFSLLLLITSIVLSPPRRFIPQVTTNLLMLLMFVFWPLLRRYKKLDVAHYFYLLIIICSFGYAYTTICTLEGATSTQDTVMWPFIFATVGIFSILFCPYFNFMVVITFVMHIGLAIWVCQANPLINAPRWFVAEVQILVFALAAAYGRIFRARKEALGELNSRTLMLKLEQARVENEQRDFAIARQMQDSFTPPETFLTWKNFHVQFYTAKYGLLGGDWMASRKTDEKLILVVADATGKGISAGLIVHAIHSLWAFSLQERDFDPIKWIEGANRTLCEMGDGQDHSMSLAITVIEQRRATYYSAGHVPMFLIFGQDETRSLKTVTGGGAPLGISQTNHISPITVDWDDAPPSMILLGTDGVFDRGTRTSKKIIDKILRSVTEHGSSGLDCCETNDDKLLVTITAAN